MQIRNRRINFWESIQVWLPFLLFLLLWELSVAGNARLRFLFASPVLVTRRFFADLTQSMLLYDVGITGFEMLMGFLLGCGIGSIIGLLLWFSDKMARLSRPYIIAVGSIPIFAIAPMMIIWFGTGLFSKIVMAALSTVVVAMVQAYEGARNVDPDLVVLMKTFRATKSQIYRKVVVPSSLVWVIASYKLNIGFALLGAFIGEFVSSERGLGHYILRGGGVYDVSQILSGVTCIIILSLGMSFLLGRLERVMLPWKYKKGPAE